MFESSGLNENCGNWPLSNCCMAWTESLEPIIPNDYASSRAPLLEHPQIIREGFRGFIACEVPTGIVFRFEHDIWPEAPIQEVSSTYYFIHHSVSWTLDFQLGSLKSPSDSSPCFPRGCAPLLPTSSSGSGGSLSSTSTSRAVATTMRGTC